MKPTAIKSASHPVTNQVAFDSIKHLVKESVKMLNVELGRGSESIDEFQY
jgi:hypothetical protein